MRHYEIVFMIHPNKSEKSNEIISKYKKLIFKFSGEIHRLEDWGRRQLSYPIKNLSKAHYVLMNIEISQKYIKNIEQAFKFDDSIIRNIIFNVKEAISEISPILKEKNNFQNMKENIVVKKINL
ncbi:30S ribosomal protein S6 [Buchnera aphidicola]|uniref:30S ribosomal protein S6 n=1 Tax=Buchnera aphidicola TaxID=9 RepID=UPI00209369FC|nr:30S ribosomal protein S6 [Buchnera aphidicola]USS94110.1 30S ribosomal protein S6 [Buchnera aphidicola (Sipha maydis)]WII23658.1 30S ribosomal protein S6 [Buchnera aphidicola (Sipha maydis)]